MEQTSLHTSHTTPLTYICAQPAILYYEWQLEVMIHNFRKNGIRDDQIHVVLGNTDVHSVSVHKRLQEKYPTIVFALYGDTRTDRAYLPSIQPHILKKHFTAHPYLQHHAIFYHDCDMVFTRSPNWDRLIADDVWYFSDTTSYIGANYIKSKGLNILQEMCDIVGVSIDIVTAEESNSGGAQHIMKNLTAEYWEKVEYDSYAVSSYFHNKASSYTDIPNYHPIQSWTAGMWALLWNGWYFGHDIKVVKDMDFCWATDSVELWDTRMIYHNAGVVSPNDGMFFKAQYTDKYPRGLHLHDYKPTLCSHKYVKEIIETLG